MYTFEIHFKLKFGLVNSINNNTHLKLKIIVVQREFLALNLSSLYQIRVRVVYQKSIKPVFNPEWRIISSKT